LDLDIDGHTQNGTIMGKAKDNKEGEKKGKGGNGGGDSS